MCFSNEQQQPSTREYLVSKTITGLAVEQMNGRPDQAHGDALAE